MRVNAGVYAQPIFEGALGDVGKLKIGGRKFWRTFKKVAIPAAIIGGAVFAPAIVAGTTTLLAKAKSFLISRGVPPELASIKARDIVEGRAPVPPEVQQELAAKPAEAGILGGGMMPFVLLGGGALLIFVTMQPARRRRR